jgi:hypothetical protein
VTIIAALLMGLAGHCVLRLLVRRVPLRGYGVLATAGLSVLLGAAVVGLTTTYAGVLGLPTRVWVLVGPVVTALAVLGVLPSRAFAVLRLAPEESQPTVRPMSLADGVVGSLIVALGAVLLTGSSKLTVFSNDEWAIWAIRGRTLSLAGHLDPAVFQGAAAQYQHLDYPLLIPSLIAWADGIAAHPDDSSAHVLLILLMLGMLAVVGWAVNRLAGPYAGACSVLLIAGTSGLLGPYGLRLFADVPLAAFAVTLVIVLAMWIVEGDGRMLAVGAALAAGTAAVKDEGVVFALAGLLAALAVPAQVRHARRQVLLAMAAMIASMLPWLVWTRVHGIESDLINGQTLNPHHLRQVAGSSGLVVRLIVHYWPGYGWWGIAGGVLAVALAATVPRLRRLTAYVCLAWFIAVAGMWAQYVISAGRHQDLVPIPVELRGHFASSATRVLIVPSILASLAMPLLAGSLVPRLTRPIQRVSQHRPSRTPAEDRSATTATE